MDTTKITKINWREILLKMSDRDIEILVRQKLGQQYAILCMRGQPHRRFNFHAATASEKAENYGILSLFDDIICDGGDHYHSPTITAYKGVITFHSMDETADSYDLNYSGFGTVDILVFTLKKFAKGGSYINGNLCFAR